MHSAFKSSGDMLSFLILILIPMTLLLMVGQATVHAVEEDELHGKNRLQSVSLEGEINPSIVIKTEKPVGYRYTIYDSFDPLRVVIDFPGLDASEVQALLPSVTGLPIQDIKISTFDLASGQLGRIEIFLVTRVGYKVQPTDQDFRVTFESPPSVTPKPIAKTSASVDPSVEKMPATVGSEVEMAEAPTGTTVTPPDKNRLQSVSFEEGAAPSLLIKTKKPVGYRYTIYDSFDPLRVVIDFPDLDVEGVEAQVSSIGDLPVQDVKISTLPLSSGQMGRVELFLGARVGYKVQPDGDSFRVVFAVPTAPVKQASTAARLPVSPPVTNAPVAETPVSETPVAKTPVAETPTTMIPGVADAPREVPSTKPDSSGKFVKDVQVEGGRALILLDGDAGKIQYFTLGAPPRLVVDLFGVSPDFKKRFFPIAQGFKQLRIGSYPDKTRFVFDVEGARLPDHSVDKQGASIIVDWGNVSPSTLAPLVAGVPVTVEAVDFNSVEGKSVVAITLSARAEAVSPRIDGDVIRFGVKNAAIGKALRRALDASAFPGSVRMVTPYTVQDGQRQDVLFAVELKGPVPFTMREEGRQLQLSVDNGPFSEPPATKEIVQKPVVQVAPPKSAAPPIATMVAAPASVSDSAVIVSKPTQDDSSYNSDIPQRKKFTGQKISLVFDDADIRMILKLIGEVSETNIIASDDVKGTITLRLVDVPWDQALELVMDIKGLGQLREGNVVRILPHDKLRALRQAELTSVRDERELEPVTTEVISVSYTSLANISAPVKDLLTKERGKVTEDNRNKQLIVTDVPAVIREVRRLVSILDTPERQVLIEARIVEASSSFGRDLGVKWGVSYDDTPGGTTDNDRRSGSIGLGGGFLISPPLAGTVIGNAGLGSGLQFGRVGIDSTVLDLRISALETSGYGKVVSTPRISTLNGGQATISQGTKIPYQSTDDSGKAKTEFIDANLQLTVTPVINPDNSIILDIAASNSSIGSTVSTGAGSAPAIDTKDAKTKILVRDGETTVIGGIFVETENFGEAGVPLLRSIPILGHFFKSTNRSTTKGELLIFITPRIVN